MKKVLILILTVSVFVSAVFAGDLKFFMADADTHSSVLNGLCPVYLQPGVSYGYYKGGNLTQFKFSAGGGLRERVLYQDPKTGKQLESGNNDLALMDTLSWTADFKISQGIGDSWTGDDLFTIYAGIRETFEKRMDSAVVRGKYFPKNQKTTRWLGGSEPVEVKDSLSAWLNAKDSDFNTSVYPEFANESSYFTLFYSGITLNMMQYNRVSKDGILAEFSFTSAPELINRGADFNSFDLNIVLSRTLWQKDMKNSLNLFAVSVVDRINLNYTDGMKVPSLFQKPVSLGKKVRGFDDGSYASTCTIVNNFEIRLSGPEFAEGVFIRANLFFDCGLGLGKRFNTGSCAEQFEVNDLLMSAGVQIHLDIKDSIDLGISVADILKGTNMRKPGKKIQIGTTFTLDF